jgi:hypothetical protein
MFSASPVWVNRASSGIGALHTFMFSITGGGSTLAGNRPNPELHFQ